MTILPIQMPTSLTSALYGALPIVIEYDLSVVSQLIPEAYVCAQANFSVPKPAVTFKIDSKFTSGNNIPANCCRGERHGHTLLYKPVFLQYLPHPI